MEKKEINILPTKTSRPGGGILTNRKHPGRLEKFDKYKKQKRIMIGSAVGLLLLLGGMRLYKTFAVYEVKKEFNILRGRIPAVSNGDVVIDFTVNGTKTTGVSFPTKTDNYIAESVTCDNGVTASWNNKSWGLVDINSNNQPKIKCMVNFIENPIMYEITNGTYYFAYDEATNKFLSNNQGKHSTNAETTLTFTKAYAGTIIVKWTVSSESNYDKLTITYKGTAQVNAVSGEKNGSFEITDVAVGDTLYFKYSKDSSASSGTDTATVELAI